MTHGLSLGGNVLFKSAIQVLQLATVKLNIEVAPWLSHGWRGCTTGGRGFGRQLDESKVFRSSILDADDGETFII